MHNLLDVATFSISYTKCMLKRRRILNLNIKMLIISSPNYAFACFMRLIEFKLQTTSSTFIYSHSTYHIWWSFESSTHSCKLWKILISLMFPWFTVLRRDRWKCWKLLILWMNKDMYWQRHLQSSLKDMRFSFILLCTTFIVSWTDIPPALY